MSGALNLVGEGMNSAVSQWLAGQEVNNYKMLADRYRQASVQSLIDSEAQAVRREQKGTEEMSKIRNVVSKAGVDISSGSASAIGEKSAANISLEAEMLRHIGIRNWWENKMGEREARAGAYITLHGKRKPADVSQGLAWGKFGIMIASAILGGAAGGAAASAAGTSTAMGVASGVVSGLSGGGGGGGALSYLAGGSKKPSIKYTSGSGEDLY